MKKKRAWALAHPCAWQCLCHWDAQCLSPKAPPFSLYWRTIQTCPWAIKVSTQCKPSTANKDQIIKINAHWVLNEAHPRVLSKAASEQSDNASSLLFPCKVPPTRGATQLDWAVEFQGHPTEHLLIGKERELKRSIDTQQLAQQQVQISIDPNKMGEEWAYNVISKTIVSSSMLSPKIPVVFVLQILLSPPYSHCLIDKHNLKMEAGRRPHNIVNKPNMNLLMPCCKAPGLLWLGPGLTLGIDKGELCGAPRHLICFLW